jgi:hypothetical protein
VSMIRGAVLASFQLHYESSTDLPQMFLLINCDRPDRRATVVVCGGGVDTWLGGVCTSPRIKYCGMIAGFIITSTILKLVL